MSLLHQLQDLVLMYNLPEPDYLCPLPSGADALIVFWDDQAAVVAGDGTAAPDGWRLFSCDPADAASLEAAVRALAAALGYVEPDVESGSAAPQAGAAPAAVQAAAASSDSGDRSDSDDGLTDQQREAVRHTGGPARILAGAGTGKTRVIVSRFHHLVSQGVRPERILALTFSREAARAMREAILPGLPGAARLWVLTFHSFCLKVLQEEGAAGVRLVKEAEGRAILEAVCAGETWHYYTGTRRQQLAEDAMALIGQAKDYLLTPDDVARYAEAFDAPNLADLARAYRLYQAELQRQGLAEFGDFIARAVTLLESDPQVAERWQKRFDHILVDEFQDTNLAQFRVLQILARPHGNLVVVGDDDQAIYHFRGATDRFLVDWDRYYPGAETYVVEENFRCPQPVLEAANALISQNPIRVAKRLFTTTKVDGFPQVRHWEMSTERQEAEAIAAEIDRRLQAGTGKPGDFAILCRSLQRMGADLAGALGRRGIPFRMVGAETAHPLVEETLSLLRLAARARAGGDWGGAEVSKAGITPAASAAAGSSVTAAPDPDLLRVMARRLDPPDLYRALQEGTLAPDPALRSWLDAYRSKPLPELVYEALRFLGHLRLSLKPTTADLERLSAARALQEAAAAAASLEELASMGISRQVPGDAVSLMTIHAAKGLEFPVVFVTGLGEGIFPVAVDSAQVFYTAEAIRTWLDQGAAALPGPGERLVQHLREERRLAYVALTRAERELILTRARQYDGEPVAPSRFLAEMQAPPAELKGAADPVSDARSYLLRVATGAESGDPTAVAAAANLLKTHPEAVPIRRQEAPAPFSGAESLRLSATSLEDYRQCPRRYYYAQVLRLEEEDSIALAFGTGVHAALERYHRALQAGERPTWDELSRWWQESLERPRFESDGQYQQFLDRGAHFLNRYYRWSQGRWARIREVEAWFEVPYADRHGRQHKTVGRYDLIAEKADGTVEIIDFKTGHRSGATKVNKRWTKNSENNIDRRLQLGLYHLAYFGDQTGPKNRVCFIFLRQPKDAFPDGLLPDFNEGEQAIGWAHTPESLGLIRERVDEIIEGVLANRFERTEDTSQCMFCTFRNACEVSPDDWF